MAGFKVITEDTGNANVASPGKSLSLFFQQKLAQDRESLPAGRWRKSSDVVHVSIKRSKLLIEWSRILLLVRNRSVQPKHAQKMADSCPALMSSAVDRVRAIADRQVCR